MSKNPDSMANLAYLLSVYFFFCMAVSCHAQTTPQGPSVDDQMKKFLAEQKELSKTADQWPVANSFNELDDIEIANIETIFNIGDCLVFQQKNKTLHGVVIYSVEQENNEIYYKVIFAGKPFDNIPSIEEFKNAGLVSKLVPSSNSWNVGFCVSTMSDSLLKTNRNLFQLIGNLQLAQVEERANLSDFITDISEIETKADRLLHSEKIDTEWGIFPQKNPEILSFDYLILAGKKWPVKRPVYHWSLEKKLAAPTAQILMHDEWWYSPSYEFAPFGNDDGSDALYSFRSWRSKHRDQDPTMFFHEMEIAWNTSFEQKDWTDYDKIKQAKNHHILYTSIDYGIIGVAFAQLVLEGEISQKLKNFGIKAIRRQLLLTEKNDYQYDKATKQERIETLNKQLSVLSIAPS